MAQAGCLLHNSSWRYPASSEPGLRSHRLGKSCLSSRAIFSLDHNKSGSVTLHHKNKYEFQNHIDLLWLDWPCWPVQRASHGSCAHISSRRTPTTTWDEHEGNGAIKKKIITCFISSGLKSSDLLRIRLTLITKLPFKRCIITYCSRGSKN